MVDFRKGRPDDLGREPVGKDFLGPNIVEPSHRNKVSEPHVGRLMGNQLGPVEQFIGRGLRVQEDAAVIV